MVISINSRLHKDSVEQNTSPPPSTSSSLLDKNDLNIDDNSNNDNVERNLSIRFDLNEDNNESNVLSSSKLNSNDSQQSINTIDDNQISIADCDVNNDDDDLFSERQLHHSNSDDNLNYVEPNNSWNLWNLLYNSQEIIENIEVKIFSKLNDSTFKRRYVNICNNSLRIWTISLNTESKKTPIVLLHGFCGASGLWIQNLKQLSKSRPLYAFDIIGFGRSSRASFSSDPIVSEMQFVESIEDWRKELNIKEMILLGHSFGGYLASAYAIKYPDHSKALLLTDPWGFTEHQINNNNNNKPGDTPTPIWVRLLTNVSRYLSPLTLLRTTGPIGVPVFKFLKPDFKRKYSSTFGDSDLIYDYLYHCNNQYPSGEDGFKSISEEHGFAKNPMIKRIEKINSKIPIWFIYGSRSWIDSSPGFATKYIRNRFAYVSVRIVPGAGHHVYADKPDIFNDYVDEILDIIDSHDDDTNQNYPTTSSCSSSLLNGN